VLRALADRGADALDAPVERIASRPLITVPAAGFIYQTIGRMSRLKVRHLAVVGEDGRICGMVTSRDLLRLRGQEAVKLGDAVEQANDSAMLARAWAALHDVAANLRAEGVSGRDVAAVISHELAMLTRQAVVIAERRLTDEGHGEPPCRYAVAVLGSAGRGESLLAMDQDNALIFAEGAPDSTTDRWFERLGIVLADILHEAGVPYCKGGVMAKNPQWRGSLATWQARIAGWITRSRPEDLMSVDIFFDLLGVHGDVSMANALWRGAYDAARGEAGFAKLLAEAAGQVESGLTLFGGFRTDAGRIDLKMTGLFGIVTAARVLAIRHHIVERSTPARLAGIAGLDIGGAQDLTGLADAQQVFLELILDQQIDDIATGLQPSNKVRVKRLSDRDRRRLKQALEQMRHADTLTRDLLFRG
jgi:DNA polymerase-3 subunit epsilon/CBS domain-containing protein